MPAAQSPDERFQVVDVEDRPVAVRTRAECHADPSLIHRSIHVVVETPDGMLFQRRSARKDTHPLEWDTACGGHVDAGESYEDAAVRELHEELGLDVTAADLVPLGTMLVRLPTETEMTRVYRLRHPGPFRLALSEVAAIGVWAGAPPEPLTPSARRVLEALG